MRRWVVRSKIRAAPGLYVVGGHAPLLWGGGSCRGAHRGLAGATRAQGRRARVRWVGPAAGGGQGGSDWLRADPGSAGGLAGVGTLARARRTAASFDVVKLSPVITVSMPVLAHRTRPGHDPRSGPHSFVH